MARSSALKTRLKNKLKLQSELALRKAIAKEREIGINPKYMNSTQRARSEYTEATWKKASEAWDRENAGLYRSFMEIMQAA